MDFSALAAPASASSYRDKTEFFTAEFPPYKGPTKVYPRRCGSQAGTWTPPEAVAPPPRRRRPEACEGPSEAAKLAVERSGTASLPLRQQPRWES